MILYSVIWACFHPLDKFFPDAQQVVVHGPEDITGPGVIIFHGGEDISPTAYKKGRSRFSGASEWLSPRDKRELTIMNKAIQNKLLLFGICRGAQLLCARAGGFLYQHVDNHAGEMHKVTTIDGRRFYVNSLHHQMCAPWKVQHELLAVADKQTTICYDEDKLVTPPAEVEAVYYPLIHGLGAQWHPEAMDENTPQALWLKEQLEARL